MSKLIPIKMHIDGPLALSTLLSKHYKENEGPYAEGPYFVQSEKFHNLEELAYHLQLFTALRHAFCHKYSKVQNIWKPAQTFQPR